MEELGLGGSSANGCLRDQIGQIVEAIRTNEAGTLKKLNLHFIDVSLVDAQSLARMVTQVEKLHVISDLGEEQTDAIFLAIAPRPRNLRELSMRPTSDEGVTLYEVDADVLAHVANSLKCFEIDS